MPVLTAEEFVQLYRIRCALEGLAAEQAAAVIGPPQLKTLRVLLRSIDAAIKSRDRRSYLLQNQKFHFFIYERCQAPLLLEMIQELWIRMGPLLNALVEDDDYLARGNDEHVKILSALAKGEKKFDKRETIKRREQQREMDRAKKQR